MHISGDDDWKFYGQMMSACVKKVPDDKIPLSKFCEIILLSVGKFTREEN